MLYLSLSVVLGMPLELVEIVWIPTASTYLHFLKVLCKVIEANFTG